jgi:hypothetical protein
MPLDSSSKHKNRQLLKLPVLRVGLLNCSTVALVFHTEAGGSVATVFSVVEESRQTSSDDECHLLQINKR